MDVVEHDILVVGGGLAGLRAAIAAAEATRGSGNRPRVGLVSKVYPVRSHTVSAEGGAAAVLKEYDSFDLHCEDTIRGSDYLADQDVVEAFVHEAPEELIQMEHWGCPWSREPDGKVAARAFGGMSVKRTLFAADKTGFHMLHTLFQTLLKYPQVARYDEWFATSLLVEDGKARGVVAIEMASGTIRVITAGAVIMATGGLGRVFPFTTNGAVTTGDGMALAYRAGAPLKDMEFVQYHPTGLPGSGILITEAARGEGGHLLNARGERFLERYVPGKMELGPRDLLSRAIITELEEGRGFGEPKDGYVYLDVRHLGRERLEERLPFILELARNYAKIDPVKEPIPVRPVVHYMMGGIHTDITGRSPLEGLYAAGEAACVTINGANRLGSNSLTECLVFGARAGRAAAAYALEAKPSRSDALEALARDEEARIEQKFGTGRTGTAAQLRREMQSIMEESCGVYRTEESLQEASEKLADLRERAATIRVGDQTRAFNVELQGVLELENMADLSRAIVEAALTRRESRGSQSRRDYAERNDRDHLHHYVLYHTAEGPRVETLPATITRWQPAERKY